MQWQRLLESRETWAPLNSPKTLGRFCLDTSCFVDLRDDDPYMLRLVEERISGFIELVKTDLVDIELNQKYNSSVGESFEVSIQFVELMGIFVLGDSRLNHAVLAVDSDVELFAEVRRILKPGTVSLGNHDDRDARHVATALRYGCNAFVTTDKNILKRGPEVVARWGAQIVDPERAIELVDAHKLRWSQYVERMRS